MKGDPGIEADSHTARLLRHRYQLQALGRERAKKKRQSWLLNISTCFKKTTAFAEKPQLLHPGSAVVHQEGTQQTSLGSRPLRLENVHKLGCHVGSASMR
jgi:hypothetical protein